MTGAKANPNGRPVKGYSITAMFQEMFTNNPERKAELGEAIYRKAKQGDPTALKLVWNYMDGTPISNLDVKSDGKELKQPTFIVQTVEAKESLKKLYEGSDSTND